MASFIDKGYTRMAEGQLHHRFAPPVRGVEQKTKIVFLHMASSSSASFEKLMLEFAALGHPCYAPDMPGFGGSFDIEPEKPGIPYYTNLFIEWLKPLGSKFYIVGHHTGAILAVSIAVTCPDLVTGVCMIGPVILKPEEREIMKVYTDKDNEYNKPVADGSHLVKTWNYLKEMGIGNNLDLWQREGLDHIRAWTGRNQVYRSAWDYDVKNLFVKVECPMMALCAKDDVLWRYFYNVKESRPTVMCREITGANFEPDRDVEGITKRLSPFLAMHEELYKDIAKPNDYQ